MYVAFAWSANFDSLTCLPVRQMKDKMETVLTDCYLENAGFDFISTHSRLFLVYVLD